MENIYNSMIQPHPIKTYLIWTKHTLFARGGGRPKALKTFYRPQAVIKFSGPLVISDRIRRNDCSLTFGGSLAMEMTRTANKGKHA